MADSRRDDKPGELKRSGRFNGRREDAPALNEGGILGALPHTRPQRTTPRRAAAQVQRADSRGRAEGKPAAKRTSAKQPARPAPAGRKAPAGMKAPAGKKAPSRTAQPRAPRQGYEPEEELELGATVHPPSGVELVESVADIVVELASAGLKAGGRALRDVLSPLRRS